MAEYYPLLSKAVSGLRDGPPEKRKAIYDRARQALVGQLRSMEQANPELIDRETRALDDAIAQVEREIGTAGPARPPEVTPSATTPKPQLAAEPKRPALPPRPAPSAGARERPARPFAVPPRPGSTLPRPPPPAAASAAVAKPEPGSDPASVLRATRDLDERTDPPVLPVAPRLQVKAVDPAEPDPASPGGTEAVPPPRPTSREEAARPVAPRQPVVKERFSARGLVVALVAALVVAGIGYAAWRLRDRPEALARARAALQAAHQADLQPGKVDNRADGGAAVPATVADQASSGGFAPKAADPGPAPSPEPATPPPPQPAAVQQEPATEAPPPSAQATPPAPPETATAAMSGATEATAALPAAPGNPAVAVSQRAAFLVDAPNQEPKVKTYVGTVVWTTENVSPGQGQPLATAIRAEVDVPEADLKLSMLVQKNVEAQFPASHTIELRFTPTAGNTLGNVKQINVPQMRKDDMPTGDALAGLPVSITENYFLVGLTRGDVVSRNLDLLQSRNWIDVPCLLASGKVAKITFEKGTAGDKLVADAIQSWQ